MQRPRPSPLLCTGRVRPNYPNKAAFKPASLRQLEDDVAVAFAGPRNAWDGRRTAALCPEPPGFSLAIVGAMLTRLIVGSRECREEIREEADHLGRHDYLDAARRCRGPGACSELGVGASRYRAHEVQAQDAGGRHSHGKGDELA